MLETNAVPPEHMSPAERRAEVAYLLAVGLVRLREGRSPASGQEGERSVDLGFIGHQRVHGNPSITTRTPDEHQS